MEHIRILARAYLRLHSRSRISPVRGDLGESPLSPDIPLDRVPRDSARHGEADVEP